MTTPTNDGGNTMSTCATCGHTWKTGTNGSHNCASRLSDRVKRLEGSLRGDNRLLSYMMGWKKGAGASAISKEQEDNPDFMRGWYAGRKASADAYTVACEFFDAKLSVLRAE